MSAGSDRTPGGYPTSMRDINEDNYGIIGRDLV